MSQERKRGHRLLTTGQRLAYTSFSLPRSYGNFFVQSTLVISSQKKACLPPSRNPIKFIFPLVVHYNSYTIQVLQSCMNWGAKSRYNLALRSPPSLCRVREIRMKWGSMGWQQLLPSLLRRLGASQTEVAAGGEGSFCPPPTHS